MRVGFYVDVYPGCEAKMLFAANLEGVVPGKLLSGFTRYTFYLEIPDEAVELAVEDVKVEEAPEPK